MSVNIFSFDFYKMEEYEAKVRVRRQLRMNGEDEAADAVEMYSGDDEKIVGLN